jgi:DNA replicative helicase MCM subunit Mcm2 (Cdc46/Mcm family)
MLKSFEATIYNSVFECKECSRLTFHTTDDALMGHSKQCLNCLLGNSSPETLLNKHLAKAL